MENPVECPAQLGELLCGLEIDHEGPHVDGVAVWPRYRDWRMGDLFDM